jgi:uncharacterized protein (TIGR03435 family)
MVATNVILEEIIKLAYFPQLAWYFPKEKGVRAPQWVGVERYTIQAKVDHATTEKWKSLTHRQLLTEIKPAVQMLLVQRCKLALHNTTEERPIWALVVGKQKPKLANADPNKAHPARSMGIAEGGVMVANGYDDTQTLSFFGAPMESLAEVLTRSSSRLVFDKTGLSGKYDFVLAKHETGSPAENTGSAALDPALPTNWDVEALGLKLKSATGPTQILVVDHIERPSEN